MFMLLVGLNYKTAPVEMRERFTFSDEELPNALKKLRNSKSILECVIISTCNRTEIYVVADQLHTGRHYTKTFLAEWFNMPKDDFSMYLDIREEEHAVEHLLKVASGLDSMILGETQILGQVRNSFLFAQGQQVTGTIFNHLFKQAITFAKRAHSKTDIGKHAVSVSYAAVELGKKIFGDFSNKHVLILGAGKMSELTAKHLHGNGAKDITVINRTMEKAEELALRFAGQARAYEQLEKALSEVDILITSTGARGFVITKSMIENVMKQRKGKPLFMVDIAVPRDLDPEIASFDDVYLYDIDDLQNIVEANLAERKREADKIELMMEAELVEFKSWLSMLGVVPIITALRTKALAVQAETMESIERKMPDLTERERKVLSKHTKSIVNQLLRDPVTRVKELAGEEKAEEALEMFTKIFALEAELEAQQQQERIIKAEEQWENAKKQEIAVAKPRQKAAVRS
ncbi:glutamyl-tRNA reductase [Alkalihalobacillus alcalophilus ATCC 27647 = CGMCC 1.3604]|uniref:Glutamyl-tRNA reductase n=1 Tax=Alkalihalobacillus alcalophilus ATCC 27647 = CGMCC 1.3604 TaxID=1218173 RepID=A0A094WJY8_ALKAL|nr:glutamyl-tRNA reductase [Alkalihalobacillus alcalophilus]KGA98094.1 glutamyl-tRNA reductase [Alkalihalobacillus alcalophilus ATCC 27647 = CGMCC 1.3604]MED1561431.1 glutamyl-tRNA reductase [Alkalihalobacillus alcalophilus]THG90705.1 glutamyl-tRNA reductase [Alkalihalobacillus alcalophilus ATCC 27647 = CGMCC 1.3604]